MVVRDVRQESGSHKLKALIVAGQTIRSTITTKPSLTSIKLEIRQAKNFTAKTRNADL